MNPAARSSMVTVARLIFLISIIVGINISDSSGNGDLSDLDTLQNIVFFVMLGNEFPPQISLWFGLSVFILFVMYLGGRSKNKRFHDLVPSLGIISNTALFKAALVRAAFVFLIIGFCQKRQTITWPIRFLPRIP